MSDEPFLRKLRELNQGRVEDDAVIEPEGWDSVEVLELIAAIDESFSITVPIDQLNDCRTVGELRALILSAE